MIERITEGLVVQAVREWAARRNQCEANAVASVQKRMISLRGNLSGAEYEQALTKIYLEYNES